MALVWNMLGYFLSPLFYCLLGTGFCRVAVRDWEKVWLSVCIRLIERMIHIYHV